jgi:hypothetical protein
VDVEGDPGIAIQAIAPGHDQPGHSTMALHLSDISKVMQASFELHVIPENDGGAIDSIEGQRDGIGFVACSRTITGHGAGIGTCWSAAYKGQKEQAPGSVHLQNDPGR